MQPRLHHVPVRPAGRLRPRGRHPLHDARRVQGRRADAVAGADDQRLRPRRAVPEPALHADPAALAGAERRRGGVLLDQRRHLLRTHHHRGRRGAAGQRPADLGRRRHQGDLRARPRRRPLRSADEEPAVPAAREDAAAGAGAVDQGADGHHAAEHARGRRRDPVDDRSRHRRAAPRHGEGSPRARDHELRRRAPPERSAAGGDSSLHVAPRQHRGHAADRDRADAGRRGGARGHRAAEALDATDPAGAGRSEPHARRRHAGLHRPVGELHARRQRRSAPVLPLPEGDGLDAEGLVRGRLERPDLHRRAREPVHRPLRGSLRPLPRDVELHAGSGDPRRLPRAAGRGGAAGRDRAGRLVLGAGTARRRSA